MAEPATRNIAFLGKPGTGKTHLACGLLIALADFGIFGRFVDWTGMITEIKASEDQREFERRWLAPLRSAPIVVLDDMGATDSTDHLSALRDYFFNCRWKGGLSTIITANLKADELHGQAGRGGCQSILPYASVINMRPGDQRITRRPAPPKSDAIHPTEPCRTLRLCGVGNQSPLQHR